MGHGRIAWLLCLVGACTSRPVGWTEATHGTVAPNYGYVFDDTTVRRLDITVSSDGYKQVTDDLEAKLSSISPSLDMQSEKPIYVPVDVTCEGVTWWHVGMRYKGNASLASAYQKGSMKLPFRLDFSKFDDDFPDVVGQRFYGFRKLLFSNAYGDPSLIREKVGQDLFRAFGVPAARTAFVAVYIDYGKGSKYMGVYTMLEDPKDTLIRSQFSDSTGNLYKPQGTQHRLRRSQPDSAVHSGAPTHFAIRGGAPSHGKVALHAPRQRDRVRRLIARRWRDRRRCRSAALRDHAPPGCATGVGQLGRASRHEGPDTGPRRRTLEQPVRTSRAVAHAQARSAGLGEEVAPRARGTGAIEVLQALGLHTTAGLALADALKEADRFAVARSSTRRFADIVLGVADGGVGPAAPVGTGANGSISIRAGIEHLDAPGRRRATVCVHVAMRDGHADFALRAELTAGLAIRRSSANPEPRGRSGAARINGHIGRTGRAVHSHRRVRATVRVVLAVARQRRIEIA